MPYGDFAARLLTNRFTYTPTARLQVSSLLQFNLDTKTQSASVRMRWEYIVGSELFVVYSDGRDVSGRPNRLLNHRLLSSDAAAAVLTPFAVTAQNLLPQAAAESRCPSCREAGVNGLRSAVHAGLPRGPAPPSRVRSYRLSLYPAGRATSWSATVVVTFSTSLVVVAMVARSLGPAAG